MLWHTHQLQMSPPTGGIVTPVGFNYVASVRGAGLEILGSRVANGHFVEAEG